MLIEALDPALKFYQFGIKKNLPKGEGKTVLWNQPSRLSLGYVLSEGSPVQLSAGNALSTTKVSAIIRQFGGFTDVSDMVDLTSITDVMKMAVQRLGAQAGETIERVLINECFIAHVATLGGSAHHLVKTSAEITDYWGSVSGVSVCSNGAVPGGPVGTVSSANVIAVSDIRKAIYSLKGMNVKPYSGNDYVAIVNTETAEDIVGDSTWINFHRIGGLAKQFAMQKLTKLREHLYETIRSEGLNATFNDYEETRNNFRYYWNGLRGCKLTYY